MTADLAVGKLRGRPTQFQYHRSRTVGGGPRPSQLITYITHIVADALTFPARGSAKSTAATPSAHMTVRLR